MTPAFVIIFATCWLAFLAEKVQTFPVVDRNGAQRMHTGRRLNPLLFSAVVSILVFFVGLRTSFNDTLAYRRGFDTLGTGLGELAYTDWALANNPGFYIANVFIKTFISEDPQVMLFIYGLLTIVPMALFFRRWSERLWLTFFLFIASGTLLFSMAAIKQVVAMAIGVCGISCFLAGKRLWFVFFIALAGTVHPYVILYLSAFFLADRVWSEKAIAITLATVLGGVFLNSVIGYAYAVTAMIGADYAEHEALSGKGVHLARFGVYCVGPALSLICRKQINASRDRTLILFANLSLIGWCFMFIGLFTAANMFARTAIYFNPFICLSLTTLLLRYLPEPYRRDALPCAVICYLVFFYFELSNTGFEYRWVFG